MTARLVISLAEQLQGIEDYLFLPGRAGGQQAFGGTGAGQELQLRGSTSTNLGLIRAQSPIVFDDVIPASSLSAYSISDQNTQTINGGYIGGTFADIKNITFTNITFVYEVLRGSPTIRRAANPGFSAFTLFNALSVLRGSSNTQTPLNSLCLNVGVTMENDIASSIMSNMINTGVNFAPQCRTSGFASTVNMSAQTGIAVTPTFSTISGSAVNLGTIYGVRCSQPAVALFQPQAGVESMTAYYGLRMEAMSFGGNVTKVALSCALAAASNSYIFKNDGGAQGDMGTGVLFGTGGFQHRSNAGGFGLGDGAASVFAVDMLLNYSTPRFTFQGLETAGYDNLYIDFAVAAHTIQSAQFGTASELRLGFDKWALGQTSSVGNQVGVFVAPTRATGVNGDWSDFLLTQAGNLTVDHNIGTLATWTINPASLTAGAGSITGEFSTLLVAQNNNPLGAATSAMRVSGRIRQRGCDNYEAVTPTALSANTNDWAPVTELTNRKVWRVSASSSVNLTGIAPLRTNDCVHLVNVGSNPISIQHQDTNSVASNRFITPTGSAFSLGADEAVKIWHDDTTDRWRIISTNT